MAKTALDIIKKALRIIRVLDRNQPLQADDRNDALEAFNDMILHLQTSYNNLWTMEQAVVLMEKGKQYYRCGGSGDRVVSRDDLRTQTLSVAALTGATTVTLSAALNVSAGDEVGVYLESGDFHWTTATVASTGVTVTLTNALPSNAAASARVYVYTNTITRPLRIINAQYAWRITDSEIPLIPFSQNEYFEQPDKSTQGATSQYYYSPQLVSGDLYVWPTAQSNLNVLRMTYVRPLTVAVNNIDSPDFPDEWFEALGYLLATRIMDEYGVETERQAAIKLKADEALSNNLAFDNDASPLRVELYRWE